MTFLKLFLVLYFQGKHIYKFLVFMRLLYTTQYFCPPRQSYGISEQILQRNPVPRTIAGVNGPTDWNEALDIIMFGSPEQVSGLCDPILILFVLGLLWNIFFCFRVLAKTITRYYYSNSVI